MSERINIIVKIADNKGIQVGRTIYLFNKPRVVVGFWNNSLVFATDNPKTMPEAQVLIYTVEELKEFYEEGNIQGFLDLDI